MPPHPVPIAIIGLGLIGPRHALSVQTSPSTTLSCIVDPSPSATATALQFNVPLYRSVQDMLRKTPADKMPKAAIVCTPNHTHVDISKELLEAGVDVLVEKPIAVDIASGRKLIASASQHGRNLLVGHHRRFQPCILAAKSAIESGRLGRIVAVNGLWTTFKPDEYFEGAGAWRRTDSGGVVLINLIHEIDLLHFLLGPLLSLRCLPTRPIRPRPSHPTDEGAALLLHFTSGAIGTFFACDATPSPFSFEQGTGENPRLPATRGADCYRIFGTEATLSVPDMQLYSYDGAPRKSWEERLGRETVPVVGATPFDLQVEHLAAVVRGAEEPVCSGEDAVRALVVCEAIKRALRTGETVNFEENGAGRAKL